MAIGKVKWFNPEKGYGFVAPEDGAADLFVHISAVQEAGVDTLQPEQRIAYDLGASKDGRPRAIRLCLI
jgi:CspA family cold shock protein